ncbi:MAG: tRNA-dihydrouridine synthase family protein [Eubacteriales bacterium]|nr:tRNA-dihydrouridine synthase family protein [Eubacteriales bacterium]
MKIYMAPMEGLTGYIYRNAFEKYFACGKVDKYFIPFISPNQSQKFLAKEIRDVERENNYGIYAVPQVMTNRAEDFIWTARLLFHEYGYDEINLNLGCPSGTVVSKFRGSGFLAVPDQLDAFLDEVMNAPFITGADNGGKSIKVSLKTRIGKESPEEFPALMKIFNKYELEELIVHPRIRTDYYRNSVKLESFRYAVENSKNPLCYNGDIFTRTDLLSFMEMFPMVDRIMLGRGLIADPGFIHVAASDSPKGYARDLEADKKAMKQLHDEVYAKRCGIMSGDKHAIHRMKEMWSYMEQSFEDSKKDVKRIKKAQKMAEYQEAVNIFFGQSKLAERETMNFNGNAGGKF